MRFIHAICRFSKVFFVVLFMVAVGVPQAHAQMSVLHNFAGGASDGSTPYYGGMVLSGSKLYGATYAGGASSVGIIFSMNIDGTGFTVLHTFTGAASDGSTPESQLTLNGNVLYGTTYAGGSAGFGTLYSINTDGTGFTLIHSFTGGVSDGKQPVTGVEIAGSTLYGTTTKGGANDLGTVYSISTTGTNFTILHSFAGGANDGNNLNGDNVVLYNSTLYGTTNQGGDSNIGIIYSIKTDGSGFTILHKFTGGTTDGSGARGIIRLADKLYGMTYIGGAFNKGTLYSISLEGTLFTIIHSFAGGTTDGSSPWVNVAAYGTMLYGATGQGGSANGGVLFSTSIDGTGYTVLKSLTGGTSDASLLYSTPVFTPNVIYAYSGGGGSSGNGTIFSYSLPAPTATPIPTPTPTQQGKGPERCTLLPPVSAPTIYAINRDGSDATIHVAQASDPVDRYYVSYGPSANQFPYGGEFVQKKIPGSIAYTIHALDPQQIYFIRIRGGNGCMPGSWSNTMISRPSNLSYDTADVTPATLVSEGHEEIPDSPRLAPISATPAPTPPITDNISPRPAQPSFFSSILHFFLRIMRPEPK